MPLLHHAGLCVRDIELSLRFYRDGLGLEVVSDQVLEADLHPLLGVHTEEVRFIFLGDPASPEAGIVELLDLGSNRITASGPGPGGPARGLFLLSMRADVPAVLSRLEELGLGGTPRMMPVPRGGFAATVVDPDGVMVELIPPLTAPAETPG
ncbi:VOC family protein [Mycolicibacterium sphagni]|uniref:VOC family protein n=1 Tax=Mycolicibacterium sphagni TaxID=1786 RepID=UPI0021F28A1A|nr:VOC family protein [Mycolicibacterium sphagni]MCV7175382.1 VOC family protein [Mycolicibacterium sphagni]